MRISVKNPHEGQVNKWAAMYRRGYLVSFTLARDRQGEWMTIIPHPNLRAEAPPIVVEWVNMLMRDKGTIVDAKT